MDLALIAGPKQMDQGMIDREIVLGMSLLYYLGNYEHHIVAAA